MKIILGYYILNFIKKKFMELFPLLLYKYLHCCCCCCCLFAQSCLTLLQPHRLLFIRLLWPWDSPGKNTGVGCHALL